jgi:hypothetical protein
VIGKKDKQHETKQTAKKMKNAVLAKHGLKKRR